MKVPDSKLTTFIIPSIDRPTLDRAIKSVNMQEVYNCKWLYKIDHKREGEAAMRNSMIQEAKTEWVSFLDDDDTVTSDYTRRLQEEIDAHPEADVIHFREYFLWGQMLPNWPVVEWGNVGISFSVKRDIALKHPFVEQKHEDLEFIKELERQGYNIYFSPYLVYRARH